MNPLEIRLLFKCREKPLQKKYVSQYYARYSASERKAALDTLIDEEFIESAYLPTATAKKPVTIFEITEKGKNWLSQYEKKLAEVQK